MAPLFATRIRCFYCGQRSSPPSKGNVRQWKCHECLSVNHLDEKGEITDPPVADASPEPKQPKYAFPLPRSNSDLPPSSSQSSLFCSTCLKNQHLFTQTLASYLPPPSHPDYAAYEASYPAYRKSLEERYPQVCEKCEPRVRERIRQAGYAAKADNLRRVLERSRGGRFNRNGKLFGWRSLLVSAGAMAFWASVAGQLVWDIASFMSAENVSSELGLDMPIMGSTVKSCIFQAIEQGHMPAECGAAAQPYAGVTLLLGALGVWWNPKLRHKVNGTTGRLTGLREYYQIQIVVLVARFVAWTILQDSSIGDYNPNIAPAIHAFGGVVTVISVVVSRLAIKLDTTPLVNWQEYDEPLVQKPVSQTSTGPISPQASRKPTSNKQSNLQGFPISRLAAPQGPTAQPYAPPTLPDDTANDGDAMDWIPSQRPFEPRNVKARSLQNRYSASPSVFQGQLPAVPEAPSWLLRNRKPEPAMLPVETKPNPFHNAPPVLQPTPSDLDDIQRSSHGEMVMAPPKFFPPNDRSVDTGLESLFDRTFSLADEPKEVHKGQVQGRRISRHNNNTPLTTTPGQMTSHVLKCAVLVLTFSMLASTQLFSIARNTVESTVLAVCFAVAGNSLLESLMKPMAHWGFLDFLLPILELMSCFYLALLNTHGLIDEALFDRVSQCLTAFMLVQEILALRTMIGSGPRITAPPPPSVKRPVEKPTENLAPSVAPQRTLGALNLGEASSPAKPKRQFDASSVYNQDSFSNNNNLGSRLSVTNNRLPLNNISLQNTVASSRPLCSPQPQFNPPASTFQGNLNGAGNSFNNNNQSIPYPPPFNSFSRPTEGPPLSFSSFSSLNENVLSTASTASTTDCASSTTSEAPSPRLRARQQTPHSVASTRFGSPSMTGLTLDDSPMRPQPRYSLRNRQR